MESPFQFGKVVEGNYFTNRKEDLKHLISNFDNGINTILLSPRRWGKTSLIKKALVKYNNNNKVKVCLIDLFGVRTEDEFFSLFAREIIKSTSTKVEEWIALSKDFLSRVAPQITIGTDPINDFNIKFNLNKDSKTASDILNLPEKIAEKKNIHVIYCIDEFQNLSSFSDSLKFQKLLRSVFQNHKKVVYCLFGSKRHMMLELFENKSMPFYKFGDLLNLEKIDKVELTKFIVSRFNSTKKDISESIAELIVTTMDRHSYYVQQFSHIVWNNTESIVTDKIFEYSLNKLLEQNSILFEREIENLSNTQINFLSALADEVTSGFSSKEVVLNYKLGSSANVVKIKNALIAKEIIDFENSNIVFVDPVFKLWFQKFYLRK
ncbi:MAG: ATP-binding protein [Melioribacteraceae bacterium]|nr:MAG: ATP-binding protein [Melioribacteraceae bacterium]